MNTDDYLKGQRDCKDGVEAKPGMSQDYYDGYGCQYEAEQLATYFGIKQDQRISA